MQPTKTLRVLLVISGLIAIGIGTSILLAPAQFYATNGIEIAADANLLSEIRAPGGALMVLGFMMLIGVFVKPFTLASTSIAVAVYLAYGASRLLSIGLDGVPVAGLLGATAIELVIGVSCAVLLVRSPIRNEASECRGPTARSPDSGRRGGVMPSLYEISVLTATVGSGLVAGLCFAFASFIMRAFDDLGAPQAIRAMQAINTRILRSSAMGVWFGTAVLGVLAALFGGFAGDRALAVTAAVLYGVGAVLITGRGNVPLNEELDGVDPDAPGAEESWRRYRVRWSRWNALRTVVCALATAGFALAL